MALHRQQIYTFHSTRKDGKSVALLFCLTLGTLYTSSRPLSSTGSLVFSLQTQGSRQNHMETTSPFFTARGRTRHFYACAVSPLPSIPLPLVPWNSKIIEVFPTSWKSLGMRRSNWLAKRLLQDRCLDMLVSFMCFVNLARNFNFVLNMLCSNWNIKRSQKCKLTPIRYTPIRYIYSLHSTVNDLVWG